MVKFLLRKYRTKEPTSDAELLNEVLRDNQEHYPVVFRQAVECVLLVFGVDVKEVDRRKHIYIMVPTLGLTCDAMQRGGQGLPKAGLLVVVLSVILQNRDRGPEEEIWGALNKMGVYVGREHSIFGEPRELLTQVWVRDGYLEYRQVPDSTPARYEFLWGPRAFAETSKEKFTEYLLKVNQRAFRSFPLPSAEDLPLCFSSSATEEALPQEALNKMVANMVKFLLRKYRTKEPTSDAELLNEVLRDNQEHYPVVFRQAVECVLLVFGVDVKEVDRRKHIYIMVPTLGLTCDAMQRGGQGLPKAGLLVVVLSVILQNRDRGPEEEIWGALNKMGVYVGREHSIFGEPRELLTQVWVRDGYLEYRQVPDSTPARYEFLWGPRAFAETSKEKFTEYLLKVNQRAFRSFPLPSAEDVREEVGGP
ncbi:unnamed protein product [Rangifer tarandus platyrhynchus]|uniref:MAGE domain-containing protein n=1 Tax=Rangifer tarandus platyrhynchus TaxID=3082113 RepID=A0ABN9A9W6_RANTA|nr:unnamed protein product [Rangifer tarandus platyrhynchus]